MRRYGWRISAIVLLLAIALITTLIVLALHEQATESHISYTQADTASNVTTSMSVMPES